MATRTDFGVPIDPRIVNDLMARGGDSASQILVVPSLVRPNGVWYAEGDLHTLKVGRSEGLPIELLHRGSPTYLHEHAAGWTEEMVIAITSTLAAGALQALAATIRSKVKGAIKSGLHPGPEKHVEFKLTIIRVRTTAEATDVDACTVQGPTSEVINQLDSVIGGLSDRSSPFDRPERADPPADGSEGGT